MDPLSTRKTFTDILLAAPSKNSTSLAVSPLPATQVAQRVLAAVTEAYPQIASPVAPHSQLRLREPTLRSAIERYSRKEISAVVLVTIATSCFKLNGSSTGQAGRTALNFLRELDAAEIAPDKVFYSFAIEACRREKDWVALIELYKHAFKERVCLQMTTYMNVLHALIELSASEKTDAFKQGLPNLLRDMQRHGIVKDQQFYVSVLSGCIRAREGELLLKVLQAKEKPMVFGPDFYEGLIRGCIEREMTECAGPLCQIFAKEFPRSVLSLDTQAGLRELNKKSLKDPRSKTLTLQEFAQTLSGQSTSTASSNRHAIVFDPKDVALRDSCEDLAVRIFADLDDCCTAGVLVGQTFFVTGNYTNTRMEQEGGGPVFWGPIVRLIKDLSNRSFSAEQKRAKYRESECHKFELLTKTFREDSRPSSIEELLKFYENFRRIENKTDGDRFKYRAASVFVNDRKLAYELIKNPKGKYAAFFSRFQVKPLESVEHMHAELRLLQFLAEQGLLGADKASIRLGCSKLCCATCYAVFAKYAPNVELSGTHGKMYVESKMAVTFPPFVEESVVMDALMELGERYPTDRKKHAAAEDYLDISHEVYFDEIFGGAQAVRAACPARSEELPKSLPPPVLAPLPESSWASMAREAAKRALESSTSF